MSEVLTVSEAARRLKVADGTVRRLADRGVLKVQRTSTGMRLFDRSDVDRVAAARERRAAGDRQ